MLKRNNNTVQIDNTLFEGLLHSIEGNDTKTLQYIEDNKQLITTDPNLYILSAIVLRNNSMFRGAALICEDILRSGSPLYSDLSRNVRNLATKIAFESFFELEQYESALHYLQRLDKQHLTTSVRYQIYQTYKHLGQFDNAEKALSHLEAITGSPKKSDHMEIAIHKTLTKNGSARGRGLQKLLLEYENNPTIHFELLKFYIETQKPRKFHNHMDKYLATPLFTSGSLLESVYRLMAPGEGNYVMTACKQYVESNNTNNNHPYIYRYYAAKLMDLQQFIPAKKVLTKYTAEYGREQSIDGLMNKYTNTNP